MNTFLLFILILMILGIVGVVVYITLNPQTQPQTSKKKTDPVKPKDDYVNISYGHSERCLDSNGSDIYLNLCDEKNDFQRWKVSGSNLLHKQSQKCLDGNGEAVYGHGCIDGNDYQYWKFLDTGHILHLRDGDQCIAVKDSKVVLQPCDYTGKSQTWRIKN